MSQQGRTTLKTYFESGDIPTEAQFIDLIDSLGNITDDDFVGATPDFTSIDINSNSFVDSSRNVTAQAIESNTTTNRKLHLRGSTTPFIAFDTSGSQKAFIQHREGTGFRFYNDVTDESLELLDSNGLEVNSSLGIGTTPSGVAGELSLGLTETTVFTDAGSTGATEQDWIEVTVGGTTGYIRVYATK